MDKAQMMTGKTIVYTIISVIIVFTALFAYQQLENINNYYKQVELSNSIYSLKNFIFQQTYAGFKSRKDFALALPKGVEKVCFIDKNNGYNEFMDAELNSFSRLYDDSNFFIAPFDKFEPYRIEKISINASENPLCVMALNRAVKLSLENIGNSTLITAKATELKSDCISVLYNGDPDNKIDIVFMNLKYNSSDEFANEVSDYINNVFLTIEPFAKEKSKFNFYRIDDDVDCKTTNWIDCRENEFEIKKLASNCPNDYIFVLLKRSKTADIVKPVRSSAFGNMEKINSAENKNVILHEFGHIFAGLADEYTDDSYYSKLEFDEDEYPNCDTDRCEEWKGVFDTGCFKGCSVNKFFRPTDTSIMKRLNDKDFRSLNNMLIEKRLALYNEK